MQPNSVKFIDAANKLHAAIEKMRKVVKSIQDEPDYGDLITEVSESGNPITLLEPLMLKASIQALMEDCYTTCLIDMVRKKDPERKLVDSHGDSWYELAKGPRMTVAAVRSTREALDHRVVDIKDAKTIVELVQAGKL